MSRKQVKDEMVTFASIQYRSHMSFDKIINPCQWFKMKGRNHIRMVTNEGKTDWNLHVFEFIIFQIRMNPFRVHFRFEHLSVLYKQWNNRQTMVEEEAC